jgi:hypothetical protein
VAEQWLVTEIKNYLRYNTFPYVLNFKEINVVVNNERKGNIDFRL